MVLKFVIILPGNIYQILNVTTQNISEVLTYHWMKAHILLANKPIKCHMKMG